jgi:AefR-like transcriptional repressor, C-terminal domain
MLRDFGVRLISKMSEPTTRALARVVIAAAEKFPNIGRAFYEAGPLYGATRLAAELESLQKSGALKVPDSERAAWQFVDLCQSYVYKRLLFGVVDSISREDIEASVEAGVDVFMKAYGV